MSKYQFGITFNYQTDIKYAEYICNLLENLFSVNYFIRSRKDNNGGDVVVRSSNVIDFLISQGLVLGHKLRNQVNVPKWIEERPEYRVACVRGLMDTAGGVYKHCYESGGKKYQYLKLCFTNCSKPLLNFVCDTINTVNIKAYLGGHHVSVYSKIDVQKYFAIVGFHNPKHRSL